MANRSHNTYNSVKSKSVSALSSVRERVSYTNTTSFIQKRPFISFFLALIIMFGLIVLGSTVFAISLSNLKLPYLRLQHYGT